MSMRSALLKGEVSSLLLSNWLSASGKYSQSKGSFENESTIRLGLIFGATIFGVGSQISSLHPLFFPNYVYFLGMIVLFLLELRFGPSHYFLQDCRNLSKLFNGAPIGYFGETELRSRIKNDLVFLAERILERERQDVLGAESLRSEFKETYDLLKRFGLMDARGYETYFEVARKYQQL